MFRFPHFPPGLAKPWSHSRNGAAQERERFRQRRTRRINHPQQTEATRGKHASTTRRNQHIYHRGATRLWNEVREFRSVRFWRNMLLFQSFKRIINQRCTYVYFYFVCYWAIVGRESESYWLQRIGNIKNLYRSYMLTLIY